MSAVNEVKHASTTAQKAYLCMPQRRLLAGGVGTGILAVQSAFLSAWHQLQAKFAAAVDMQLLFDFLRHSMSSHIPFPHTFLFRLIFPT